MSKGIENILNYNFRDLMNVNNLQILKEKVHCEENYKEMLKEVPDPMKKEEFNMAAKY